MINKNLNGAVLGFPVSHSLSPKLHNQAYRLAGLTGSYRAIEVQSGQLQAFMTEQGNDFDYFSLTMPLKEEALQLDLNIEIDPLSRRIQSINTLIRKDNTWRATSTDGSGFVKALLSAGHSHFDRVLIMGAGGTARAVAGVMDGLANSVDVMRRSVRRSPGIAACFQIIIPKFLDWDDAIDLGSYDLIINTTPSGAADLVAENIEGSIQGVLFDVLYKPWPTLLARRWSDAGGSVLSGLELLLFQGIDQLNLVADFSDISLEASLRLVITP
ncbi:MAG: shikimate dehydrogenase [Candidatus Planktophila sp.]